MRVLITGGCGFIGHHFVEHFLKNTDWEISILDKLNYASNGLQRIREIDAIDKVKIYTADFTLPISEGLETEMGEFDCIFHLGAETHVDRSIEDARPFVMSNVVGTMNMLEYARRQKNLKCFFYFSTDEVFGPAPDGVYFKEEDELNPKNPYAAAKAGGEMLVTSYANTYKLPCIITRCMNVFGECQDLEKFIPNTIKKSLNGEKVTIHSNPDKTRAGSRFYIHARNVADAYMFIVKNGKVGEKYNIVGEKEVDNLKLAQFIASVVGKPLNYEMVDFHSSRPGHDLRYAMSGDKMKQMGWELPKNFEESLEKTIKWTLNNRRWL